MSNRLTEWLVKPLLEDIEIPVEIGDTILTGRFKNKKTKVKRSNLSHRKQYYQWYS